MIARSLGHRASTFPYLCGLWLDSSRLIIGGGGGAERSGRENRLEVLTKNGECLSSTRLEDDPAIYLAKGSRYPHGVVVVGIRTISLYSLVDEDKLQLVTRLHEFVEERILVAYATADYLVCTTAEEADGKQIYRLYLWFFEGKKLVDVHSVVLRIPSPPLFLNPMQMEKYTHFHIVGRDGSVCIYRPPFMPDILSNLILMEDGETYMAPRIDQPESGFLPFVTGPISIESTSRGRESLRALYPLQYTDEHPLKGHYVGYLANARKASICLLDECGEIVKTRPLKRACGVATYDPEHHVLYVLLANGQLLGFAADTLKPTLSFIGKEDSLLLEIVLNEEGTQYALLSPAGVEVCSVRPKNTANRQALLLILLLLFIIALGLAYRRAEHAGRDPLATYPGLRKLRDRLPRLKDQGCARCHRKG
ncbi:hypothetical protein GMRT_13491 [Giardia muris]|uniref:Uncharacterized protein n=1 Tax=Giardia muris TaxID=5742 RepID=A0A4Z1SQA8_GIAMU|nr:hypothetical protein GMRT_13491 [Giardia muris]|eukprot:TNJ27996.1 hypothetical protein GMRT_13491 [Giardia muris]